MKLAIVFVAVLALAAAQTESTGDAVNQAETTEKAFASGPAADLIKGINERINELFAGDAGQLLRLIPAILVAVIKLVVNLASALRYRVLCVKGCLGGH